MLIYFLAYGIIFLTYFTLKKDNYEDVKRKKIFLTVSFLTLLFVFGLRHPSMGIDLGYRSTEGYLGSFSKIAEMDLWDVIKMDSFKNYEKGYVILNKLIGYIGTDHQVFIFVFSALTFIPVFYILYKKSVNPLFSLIIYMGLPLFAAHFSTLRQILAISICLISYKYIEGKDFGKFLAVVLFASLFHTSAILFTVAYPAYHIKISLPFRVASVFALPLIFIFKVPLFNILSKILKENTVADDNGSINLFLVLSMIYVFCILFFNIKDKKVNGYMNIFYICCFCQIFGGVYMTATRVAWFFMTVLIFLLPFGLTTMKSKRYSQIFSILIMCAFVAYGLYSLRSTSWAQANPYYFYWQLRI